MFGRDYLMWSWVDFNLGVYGIEFERIYSLQEVFKRLLIRCLCVLNNLFIGNILNYM